MRALRLKVGKKTPQNEEAKHLLAWQLKHLGAPVFEVEYRFNTPDTDHRWDIAFTEEKLAVEVNGGIWIQGAHAHPTTIIRNMKKGNLGALRGWRVLAFEPREVKTGGPVNLILEALGINR